MGRLLPSQAKPSQAKPSQAKPSQAKPSIYCLCMAALDLSSTICIKNFPNSKIQNKIHANSTPAIKPQAYSYPAGKKHALKYWGKSTFLSNAICVIGYQNQ